MELALKQLIYNDLVKLIKNKGGKLISKSYGCEFCCNSEKHWNEKLAAIVWRHNLLWMVILTYVDLYNQHYYTYAEFSVHFSF